MKKQLLLFAFSALALTSCEDDDIQAYEIDMLKGDWKESKREVISGKDNKTVLNTQTPTGCSAKNTLYFRTDFYTSYTAYSGNGIDCQVNAATTGKYTYDEESKALNIKFDNNDEDKYKVMVLTNQDLKIMTLSNNIDQNGDQVADYTYITYKR